LEIGQFFAPRSVAGFDVLLFFIQVFADQKPVFEICRATADPAFGIYVAIVTDFNVV